MADNQLLAIALTAVLTSEHFPCPTNEWEARLHASKMWAAWKTHYHAANTACKCQLLADGTTPVPRGVANMAAAADTEFLTPDLFACLDTYLDSLAVAVTTKHTTLAQLIESNTKLTANVASLTASIAALTSAYTLLANAPAPSAMPPM